LINNSKFWPISIDNKNDWKLKIEVFDGSAFGLEVEVLKISGWGL
jgi:hypothetical protein